MKSKFRFIEVIPKLKIPIRLVCILIMVSLYDLEVHSFSAIEFAVQTDMEAFVTLTTTLGHQITILIGESSNSESKIIFVGNSANPTTTTVAHSLTCKKFITAK